MSIQRRDTPEQIRATTTAGPSVTHILDPAEEQVNRSEVFLKILLLLLYLGEGTTLALQIPLEEGDYINFSTPD